MELTPVDQIAAELVPATLTKRQRNKLAKMVEKALKPLEAWDTIDDPDGYVESRTGKYLRLLEGLLDYAIDIKALGLVRELTLDLLRLTKLGRNKAEVALIGTNKLRDEYDFSHIDENELLRLANRGNNNDPNREE